MRQIITLIMKMKNDSNKYIHTIEYSRLNTNYDFREAERNVTQAHYIINKIIHENAHSQ